MPRMAIVCALAGGVPIFRTAVTEQTAPADALMESKPLDSMSELDLTFLATDWIRMGDLLSPESDDETPSLGKPGKILAGGLWTDG